MALKPAAKLTLANLLAHKLHRPFIDTDDLICELYAERTGTRRTIRQIYQELKEVEFRKLESATLPILKELQSTIISLGGGYVLDPNNVEGLEKVGTLVYLKADPKTILRRLKEDLPLLQIVKHNC